MKNLKYLLLASFLFVFLISPNFASATTAEELIAQIKALEEQIVKLKAQLAEIQGQTSQWCYDFIKNVKVESKGEDVAALHTVLEKEGFIIFNEERNNKEFGESTASAVSGLQQKYQDEILAPLGLKYGTGFLGKATRAKLNKLYGCSVKAVPFPFCSPVAVSCESSSKIICPLGLNEKGCPFPCKCVPAVCSQDVKTCPDGTTISRIPPSCEFAACPNQTINQPPIIYGIGGPTLLKVNEIGLWTIKASDPENGHLVYSVEWGDNLGSAFRPETLSPIPAQIATFTHSYSKAGIYNPTFIVTDKENLAVKTSISVKVEETTSPLIISEQVKCIFDGSQTEQKCNAASENYYNYGCSGIETCVIDVRGTRGDKITWKSSCGGYAYTAMDGQNDYAKFNCAAAASITVLSPNGREEWEMNKAFQIKWKQTQDAKVSIIVRNKQLPGTANSLWYSLYISEVVGKTGENSQWWDIPNYLNPHQGYEICLSGYFSGQALEDCSDAPFYIKEAAVSVTAKTCDELLASQTYYFNICSDSGYDNVCFNKFSGEYQGCTRNTWNDCTQSNANAEQNILCPFASAQKSITVLSPNGGESWQIGNAYEIKWTTTGYSSDGVVRIIITDETSGTENPIFNAYNKGIFSWTVSSTYQAHSNYKIKIVAPDEKYDKSDAPFSILPQPTQPTSCADSDKGNDIYLKGCTTYLISGGAKETVCDFCRESYIQEYFCQDNKMTYLIQNCPNGCQDGVCLATSATGLKSIENLLASISEIISQLSERIENLMGR